MVVVYLVLVMMEIMLKFVMCSVELLLCVFVLVRKSVKFSVVISMMMKKLWIWVFFYKVFGLLCSVSRKILKGRVVSNMKVSVIRFELFWVKVLRLLLDVE